MKRFLLSFCILPMPSKPIFRAYLQLLFLGLFHTALTAQEPFIMRSFVSADLPAMRINCLLQDRLGFIWIGALDGLYRYDGYRYLRYQQNAADTCSLSNSMIWAMSEDARENLWLATNGGVNRLDPHKGCFTTFPFPSALGEIAAPDPSVRAVFADSRGGVWAGTVSGSLYRLDLTTLLWRSFPTGSPNSGSFVGGAVRTFYEDAQGVLWIGSANGLSRFDPSTDAFITFQNNSQDPFSLSFNSVWSIFEDDEGALWIGSNGGGVNRFDRKTGHFTHFRHEPGNPASLSNDEVFGFCQDDRGLLWIATHGGGLNSLDRRSGHFTAYTQQSPFPYTINHNQVFSLMKDRQGLIWIATEEGLNRLDFQPKPFKKYFYQPDYPFNPSSPEVIRTILEDEVGIFWLGTENGLIRFDRSTGRTIRYRHDPFDPHSLSENRIWTLAKGNQNELWVGTWGGGLNRLDLTNGRFIRYRHVPGDSTSVGDNQIRYLLKDSDGKIWVSTGSVLQVYDEAADRFLTVGTKGTNSCCINGVNTFAEGEDSVFWMVTWGNGLYHWNRRAGLVKHFPYDPANPNGPASNHFLELFLSKDGSPWMHAIGRGLNHFDPKTERFTLYGKKDGLPNEMVQGILEDEHRRLWITTMGGLSCFDPTTDRLRNFDINDGLPANEFNFCSRFHSAHTGELFFGSINGLLAFHPDSIQLDTIRPPVVFNSFSRYNRRLGENRPIVDEWISRKKSLTLTHRDNVLSFEFAALSFRYPEGNQYAYQLEGFSDQWVQLGVKHDVMFTNLAPGRYTLHVKASNDDGVWNEEGTALELTVRHPWWATWWAYMLWVGLALGTLFFIRRYELRRKMTRAEAKRLQELDAVKSRLYTNITHEFRTPLTVILGIAEHLQTKAEEGMKPSLDLIRRNGRQLLDLVNQMLDLSKVESGVMEIKMVQADVVNYLRYLAESFHSLAQSKDIRLHFLTELPTFSMDFEPLRLQQVVSNLLANAFNFTPKGGDVYLFINKKEASLEIKVSDTGIGIPEEKLPFVFDRFFQAGSDNHSNHARQAEGTGIGLALAKELIHLMKGEIFVSNKPGGGTEFSVLLPITQTSEKQSVVLPKMKPLEETGLFSPFIVAPNKDGQAPLLLLVEDNHDVVKYLLTCLNPDYRIELAYNGQQGVEKAVELVPDLILSDVIMPQKDGFELCHTLKTDERTSHIPIILLTARADIESKLSGLRHGADAYLAKPFHKEELLTHIHNLLEIRRRLHAHYLAQAGLQARKQDRPSPTKTSLESALEHTFIQKVRTLLEADLTRQWQVPELAWRLHISDSQLHRKLEALTGMHTTEFVRYIRLINASLMLLAQPEEKIASIAYEVGFTSPNEFTRRFGEVFEMTPGEWRRRGS